jgi:hypothetical protein
MQASRRRPSPALIISIIALIASLAGTAWAAGKIHLPKNSVGSRQIKSSAVTTGKIANNAVTGSKVLKNSLDGSDIDLNKLGTVPSAVSSQTSGVAGALSDGGETRTAGCPSGATLIRGVCFDKALAGPVKGVKAAADACAAKGGWLPTPLELYSVRSVIFLGGGIPPDYAVSDDYFADPSSSSNYSTIVVDSAGKMTIVIESSTPAEFKYICAYPLVR